MSNGVFSISIITAFATLFIAYFAHISNQLSKKSYELTQELKRTNDRIKEQEVTFKQEVKDLYKAIVISNLLSGPSSIGAIDKAKKTFNTYYDGNTKIFK